MKILYIFTNYDWIQSTGQPAIVYRLAVFAQKRGNKVSIISNALQDPNIEKNVPETLLLRGVGTFRTYCLSFFKIIRFIKKQDAEIIHVHGHLLIIFVWALNLFARRQLVCSLCETIDIVEGFYQKILIFCIKRTKAIFVTANFIKNQLVEKDIQEKKIQISRIGLDKSFQRNDATNESVDILFFGDSKKERGFDYVATLCQRMSHLKFKFLLRWESDDCAEELKCLRQRSNAQVLNYPYHEAFESLIQGAKLIILPFRWMGVRPPLSLVESMALGKCVITSKMPGNEEIIQDGLTGYLMDFDDINGIVERIQEILLDDNRRQTVGQKAKDEILKIYNDAQYQKILGGYKI